MSWSIVRLIWRLEIRTLLRSRRTVILSIVLPMLLMPIMLLASRFSIQLQERREESTRYEYAITGDWADQVRDLIDAARSALPGDDNRPESLEDFLAEEVSREDPEAAVLDGEIHFYVRALGSAAADFEWAEREAEREDEDGTAEPGDRDRRRFESRMDGVPAIEIYSPGNRTTATAGARKMGDLLAYGRSRQREALFRQSGNPVVFRDLLAVEEVSLASDEQTSGLWIGRFLTLVLFMMTLAGGSVVAMDSLAGEKERGTLETLLTTAAERAEIIGAKQLVILTVALVITLIQVGNLLFYTSLDVIPLPEDFAFSLSPAAALALVLLFVPLAVLTAGVLLLLSAYAKSYKEAQLYFFPVYLIGLIPAAAGAVEGIALRSAIAVIPIANVSVAAREVLTGRIDWLMILVGLTVNSLLAFALMRYSAGLLEDEQLITAQQTTSPGELTGPAAFRSQIWKWYVVLWALLFAAAAGIPQLSAFRPQLLFNELVLFLGSSLLIVRYYGLDVRKAWALRPVKAGLWPVIILLIAPLQLTALLVHRFANTIFPAPTGYLEQLAEEFSFPGPTWQLYLLIAVLPGVCEEIAFRGSLLYGLRRKFSPVALTVVVGIVFGFFHFSIFRIMTAGVLGIAITAVALMTGSLFPGIVIHLGNNALAIWFGEAGVPVDTLDTSLLVGAFLVSLALMWIIYRNRTPYPNE